MISTKLMTIEEVARLPKEKSCELIEGVPISMTPVSLDHLRVSGTINRLLGNHVAERNLGIVGPEGGFVLGRDPDTLLAPDVAFIRAERVPPEEDQAGFAEFAPDLVVEVVSPSNTRADMAEKVRRYLDAGVSLVIVADPRRRTVTTTDQSRVPTTLTEDDELHGGEVLPAFRVPVRALFR